MEVGDVRRTTTEKGPPTVVDDDETGYDGSGGFRIVLLVKKFFTSPIVR